MTIQTFSNLCITRLLWADPREFSQQPIELLLSTSAVAKGRVAQTDVLHRDNINLVADLYKIGWVINGNMQTHSLPSFCLE